MTNHLTKHLFTALLLLASTMAVAQAAQTEFSEQEFLEKFSGKSQKTVLEILGKPFKKELSVRPSNASQVLQDKNIDLSASNEKVEMWYYKSKVRYAPNKFFNLAELTFNNEKCVNITFANKKTK